MSLLVVMSFHGLQEPPKKLDSVCDSVNSELLRPPQKQIELPGRKFVLFRVSWLDNGFVRWQAVSCSLSTDRVDVKFYFNAQLLSSSEIANLVINIDKNHTIWLTKDHISFGCKQKTKGFFSKDRDMAKHT